MIVYDPSNYAQNVLQAARALQQINNQITSLQNQSADAAQSGEEPGEPAVFEPADDRSSRSHARSSCSTRRSASPMTSTRSIRPSSDSTRRVTPARARHNSSSAMPRSAGRTRLAAYQDALRVQAGVVGNLDTTRTETDALVSSSQSAVGALQAVQAGNQLVALQTRQLADLTAVIAAQSRAQSLAGARTTANQDQAREQLSRFLGKRTELSASGRADVPLGEGGRPWTEDHRAGRGRHPARRRRTCLRRRIGRQSRTLGSSTPSQTTTWIRLPMNSHAARPLAPKQRTTPPAGRLGQRTARGSLRGRPRTWITQSSYFPQHQMRLKRYQRFIGAECNQPRNLTAAHQARIPKGAEPWGARGSSIASWRSSPPTSTPDSDCSTAKSHSCHLPCRDRYHARWPVLGARIGRGRHRPAHPQDSLRRFLCLPDRQLQYLGKGHLQLLCRAWSEGSGIRATRRSVRFSQAGSRRSESMPASRSC